MYEGEKVVPYCTRCQTALSNFETRLDDAYRPRVDTAATVAFALAPREAVLAWTTTPWTLPANAALAVHPELAYNDVQVLWTPEFDRRLTVTADVNNILNRDPPTCFSCSLNGFNPSTCDVPGISGYVTAAYHVQ